MSVSPRTYDARSEANVCETPRKYRESFRESAFMARRFSESHRKSEHHLSRNPECLRRFHEKSITRTVSSARMMPQSSAQDVLGIVEIGKNRAGFAEISNTLRS